MRVERTTMSGIGSRPVLTGLGYRILMILAAGLLVACGAEGGPTGRDSGGTDLQASAAVDLDEGLVAYYPMNGDATDHSGNGLHGIPVNGASFASGIRGQALLLDGVDDYVELPVLDLGTAGFTIAGWVLLDGVEDSDVMYSNGEGTPGCDDGIRYFGTGFDRISFKIDCVTKPDGDASLTAGQWHHIAMTADRSSETATFYLDGSPDISFSVPSIWDHLSSSARHTLGVWAAGNAGEGKGWFGGRMDEVRFYDRALSTVEVEKLAQSDPRTRSDCADGGWSQYGFANQGLCIRFVNTGKDSRRRNAG